MAHSDASSCIAAHQAFGIIGDPAKRSPTTRQSADHSMVFIVSRMIQNALKCKKATGTVPATSDDAWKVLQTLASLGSRGRK